jgi:hypothetical protein
MRAPVSRSRPLRPLPAIRWSFGVSPHRPDANDGVLSRSQHQRRRYDVDRLALAAGSAGAPGWTGVTRAGVSGRVAELVCVSVADQGPKRDVVARPGRRQCHVSVLGTTDRRQPRRDKRLERHHVRLAPGALGELDCLAGVPALRARKSRTGPEPEAQIDSSACEVEIAAHHAPRRLELQRKLEQLLHAPDRHAVGQRPGMVSARTSRARARTTRACAHLPVRAILAVMPISPAKPTLSKAAYGNHRSTRRAGCARTRPRASRLTGDPGVSRRESDHQSAPPPLVRSEQAAAARTRSCRWTREI